MQIKAQQKTNALRAQRNDAARPISQGCYEAKLMHGENPAVPGGPAGGPPCVRASTAATGQCACVRVVPRRQGSAQGCTAVGEDVAVAVGVVVVLPSFRRPGAFNLWGEEGHRRRKKKLNISLDSHREQKNSFTLKGCDVKKMWFFNTKLEKKKGL